MLWERGDDGVEQENAVETESMGSGEVLKRLLQ